MLIKAVCTYAVSVVLMMIAATCIPFDLASYGLAGVFAFFALVIIPASMIVQIAFESITG